MGNLTINNGGVVTNSTNLPNIDLRYGPYGSIQEAYGALENTIAPGLTIGIFENDGITEYIVNDKYQLTPKLKLKTINNQPIIGEGNITIEGGGGSSDSVLYTQQTLTSSQQAQARENINALSATTSETTPDISFNSYNVVVLDDESEMPATPASNTLYFIKGVVS